MITGPTDTPPPRRYWQQLLEPLRQSKSLRLALLAMLAGTAIWVFRPGTKPEASSAAAARAPSTGATAETHRLVPTSPALFRFGASFAGGFFVGFAFRRFLKFTLLVSGAVLAGIAVLKGTGLIHLDWASFEAHIRDSLAWSHDRAAALKTFLTGYLPSAFAGGLGLFKGLRWR